MFWLNIPKLARIEIPGRRILFNCLLMFAIGMGSSWAGNSLQTRSTNIDLNPAGGRLVNVNRESNSVSVFKIIDASTLKLLSEVPVGREPYCVAVAKGGRFFVTNSGSGTVSVVKKQSGDRYEVSREIQVGAEPRACALTPNGTLLYVANYTAGTLSVIDTSSETVIDTITVGGNPAAIAIGYGSVFVTQFFAGLIPGSPGEAFDDGKQGLVVAFPEGGNGPFTDIPLSPLANSGFTSNRANFCQQIYPAAVNNTYCPDTTITDPTNPIIAADPQSVYPNQFKSALICNNKLYLPNIGAQPEPPLRFNTNIQALVYVVDTLGFAEIQSQHVNLNNQIKNEVQPATPQGSLVRAFGNDLVAIDSDPSCANFFIVSRGGNYVLKARPGTGGPLDIGAPNVVRFQTGNIPTGIAVNNAGQIAYVNNEVGMSISILDLTASTVIARDIPSSSAPAPGTFEHARLMGKLVFFTALGVADNGLAGMPIRNIDPVLFRNKQSDNGWSSCGSCHDDGLSDGVTWIFATGPRQTIPLDSTYSKINGAHDVRIHNWSAVRDSTTDFNENSIGVQGGTGFAGTPPNPNVFNHGISSGASEALDFETTWVQTVRSLNAQKPTNPTTLTAGASLFQAHCASCHGGAKWTKSQVIYLNNPAFVSGVPRDPGVQNTGDQIVSYTDAKVDPNPLKILETVGTFDAADPIEIRNNATGALGSLGFNVPSLLGVGSNAPYFHNGAAPTLQDVFAQHLLPASGSTIENTLSQNNLTDILAFLNALDGNTSILRSDTDQFREPFP